MENLTTSSVKQNLITDIERRVEDKILEPSNAQLLKKLILNADDDNEAMMIAALGTTYKRTGFHFDKRLEKTNSDIKYFKKNEKLSFITDESKPTHKLIIGDNYEALQNLLIQYRGKIDVIYIDPPYGKDSLGEFAQTNYNNALTRDNLLSMLYPRLFLAKQLLSENGIILCSIDDRNQAYVKCLFDEVFMEKNHIACFPKKGTGGRQDSKHFAIVHEYILCYVRNIDTYKSGRITTITKYKYFDEKKKLHYNLQLLRKWGANSLRINRPNLYYPIYYQVSVNTLSLDRKNNDDIEIYPMLDSKTEGCWRWGKATMKEAFENDLVEVNIKKKEYIPYEKIMETTDEPTNKLFTSWIDDIDNTTGASLLKKILPSGLFDYPKAIDLIMRLIMMATDKKDAIALDFFAGSGTTGHAVLDLNKNDGGSRQFILCQLNEKTDTTPNGIAYDVTSKRLKRIMTGECYNGSKNFKWIEDNEPYGDNLDVYEIGMVKNNNSSEGKTPFDVIDETLYGQEHFNSLREKIDWVCQNFAHTQMFVENDVDWEKRVEELNNATRS